MMYGIQILKLNVSGIKSIRMKEEIKISIEQPKNFDDIHHSLELVDALDAVKRAEEKIEFYKETFVDSFIKTADEVLEYIPKNQWKKYSLCDGYIHIFDKPYKSGLFGGSDHLNDSILEEIEKVKQLTYERAERMSNGEGYEPVPELPKWVDEAIENENEKYNEKRQIKNCKTLQEKLIWINPIQKVFVVDTVNKKIEVLWGMEEPTEMKKIDLLGEHHYHSNIKKVLEGESILASCALSYEYSYSAPASDAVFISTGGHGGGYFNKTVSANATKTLYLVHKFNIRNNKYEGIEVNDFIKNEKNPPKRDYTFRRGFGLD
jgi:hypothetical protein